MALTKHDLKEVTGAALMKYIKDLVLLNLLKQFWGKDDVRLSKHFITFLLRA